MAKAALLPYQTKFKLVTSRYLLRNITANITIKIVITFAIFSYLLLE